MPKTKAASSSGAIDAGRTVQLDKKISWGHVLTKHPTCGVTVDGYTGGRDSASIGELDPGSETGVVGVCSETDALRTDDSPGTEADTADVDGSDMEGDMKESTSDTRTTVALGGCPDGTDDGAECENGGGDVTDGTNLEEVGAVLKATRTGVVCGVKSIGVRNLVVRTMCPLDVDDDGNTSGSGDDGVDMTEAVVGGMDKGGVAASKSGEGGNVDRVGSVTRKTTGSGGSLSKRKGKGVNTSRKMKQPRKKLGKTNVKKPTNKQYKWHPGTQALREIRRMQKSVDAIIPFACFDSLVRSIMDDLGKDRRGTSWRISRSAMEALQEATEDFIVRRFRTSYLVTMARKGETLTESDMKCAQAMYEDN